MQAVRELAGDVATGNVELAAAQAMLAEMSIRQNNWSLGAYCARYCTFVAQHHYGEDVEIFPHLRRRDETLAPILDRLADEHEIIHQLLDDLDQALTALVSGRPEAPSLPETAEVLSNALLSHLAYEEQELLTPMAHYFG